MTQRKPGTSKITGDRASTLTAQFLEQLNGIYATVAYAQDSSEDANRWVKAYIYSDPLYERLPQHAQGTISAVHLALSKYISTNQVEHVYLFNGKMVPGRGLVGGPYWDEFKGLETKKRAKDPDYHVPSALVWKGTERYWFTGFDVNQKEFKRV